MPWISATASLAAAVDLEAVDRAVEQRVEPVVHAAARRSRWRSAQRLRRVGDDATVAQLRPYSERARRAGDGVERHRHRAQTVDRLRQANQWQRHAQEGVGVDHADRRALVRSMCAFPARRGHEHPGRLAPGIAQAVKRRPVGTLDLFDDAGGDHLPQMRPEAVLAQVGHRRMRDLSRRRGHRARAGAPFDCRSALQG